MAVHRSRFPELAIPDQSITECALAGLAGREDAPAFIDGVTGSVLTGADFVAMVHSLAGGLAARGCGHGSTIALMAPNLPEYAAVFHAVAFAGGTITTVNPTYTADEVRHQLRDAGATLLVTVPACLATARAAAEGTAVAEIAVIGEAEGATPLSALMGPPLTAQVPVDLDTHVVVLPYSSGTTGLPKGVMLSHRNLVANVLQCRAVINVYPGVATLAVLPYFHIYGMTVLMNLHLACGGVQVTLPRFDLQAALALIQTHRMRSLFVVPPVVLALARHPIVASYDLGSLDFILSGAAPLGAELGNAAAARLGCAVLQGYGMTELSPVSHAVPLNAPRAAASGVLVPNTECRIVAPGTDEDVAPGEVGEVWIRGPQCMLGYLGNPAATAATIDADGWLRTGDLGHVDAQGYLFVVDRVKELIKVKGFQVAPAELEALLLTCPGIADAAVVGRPDDETGEVPVAFVVCTAGAETDLAAVQRHLDPHVAHYKQVRDMVIVDAIPKSPSGKILRRHLRARL